MLKTSIILTSLFCLSFQALAQESGQFSIRKRSGWDGPVSNSGPAPTNSVPPAPRPYIPVDTSRMDCAKELRSQFPSQKDASFEEACRQDTIKNTVLGKEVETKKDNKSDTNGAPPIKLASKEVYLQCLKSQFDIKNSINYFITDCIDESMARKLLNPEYAGCFKSTHKKYGAFAAYTECQNPFFLRDYKSADFSRCEDVLDDLKQKPETALEVCKNQSDRFRVLSSEFSRCQNDLDKIKIQEELIFNFCFQDKSLSAIKHVDYNKCLDSVKSMTRNTLTPTGLCASSVNLLETVQKNPACVQKSVNSAYKNFVGLTAFYSDEKGYFDHLVKDCDQNKKAESVTAAPSQYLKLIKDINLHSLENLSFPNGTRSTLPVGGLSALVYDSQKQILTMLSDETLLVTQSPPRMYTYSFNQNLELKDSKIIAFNFGDAIPPRIDPEGLVQLKDGRFIVASENEESQAQKADEYGRRIIKTSNLNVFDKEAYYKTDLDMPDSFKTRFLRSVKKIFSRGKGPDEVVTDESLLDEKIPSEVFRNSPVFKVQKPFLNLYGNGSIDDDEKTPKAVDITYTPASGLQYNKSIESLGISPDESVLFIGNESHLLQDADVKGKCIVTKKASASFQDEGQNTAPDEQICAKTIRIARYARTNNPEKPYRPLDEFKYELDPVQDNGLVEILGLSSTQILTLERSYDFSKQKVTSRIFRVALTSNSLIPRGTDLRKTKIDSLQKTLIVDLDNVDPEMSPGFRYLDNYEGMTFGPTLPNGNKTLLVVSDNNFGKKQRTSLLVFEVTKDLLQETASSGK